MPHLSAPQVLALAPDAASAKAGQGLASSKKWSNLGYSDHALWGECQGSGSKPYQTVIDTQDNATKCSCPSRKFPCKHALGLYLLYADNEGAFVQGEPLAWVTEWLEKRSSTNVKKKEKAEDEAADPDKIAKKEATKAKRAETRMSKVMGGVAELELWLYDLIRRGLGTVPGQPYRYWDTVAARMVDAQAPGLARVLRECSGIASSGEGWTERLLDKVGKLSLLLEAAKRLESLPPPLRADVETALGLAVKEEDLTGEPITDSWLVLGQRQYEEENLRVQRLWLWGETNGRAALLLSFAFGNAPFNVQLASGTRIRASLLYYPSNYPLRASLKTFEQGEGFGSTTAGYACFDACLSAYADALACSPWLERFPAPLHAILPVQREGVGFLRDSDGKLLPLAHAFDGFWTLLALSGGYPLTLFGEWDGQHYLPLSAQLNANFVSFDRVTIHEP